MIFHRDHIPADLIQFFVRAEIGLEATPSEFVAAMVAVFREARRVLRDDGTLWCNLGDSYAGTTGFKTSNPQQSRNGRGVCGPRDLHPSAARANASGYKDYSGLKPKDLIGIPWRVAFALQEDGWWLRQDIIWSKPNPMPESVQDRCTKAHEYLFLLTKSARYFFDAAAVAEDGVGRETYFGSDRYSEGSGRHDSGSYNDLACGKRNKRSVWTVATQPFKEAHFATFPPALIEPCVLAGSPAGGTVLDPFGGAGTTGLVADRLGRDAILIELNPAYAAMAAERITREQPMFAAVTMEAA